MAVKATATIEDLVKSFPMYKEALLGYITQLSSGLEVVHHKDSSTLGKTKAKEGGPVQAGLRTNTNRVEGIHPSEQSRKTTPALFGVTSDGAYGLIQGGFWERLVLNQLIGPVHERADKLMKTPINCLTLS